MSSLEKAKGEISPTGHEEPEGCELGQTQELKKRFSPLTVLSLAVILMATWEALSSVMVSGLVSGGPVSLIYGYILATIGSLSTAASLAEMASMYPTAGGQYHFVSMLAPDKWRNIFSWFNGWISTFGWIALTASAPYIAAPMIQGLLVLVYETYTVERWHSTMIYWALIVLSAVINIWGVRLMSIIQISIMAVHVLAFIALLVVMWVCSPSKHDTSFVFAYSINNSGWSSSGVAWCIGMLSSCYVLVGYDGAIHLSEEMRNPRVAVPYCMLGAVAINGVIGFVFLITLLYCMGDIQTALASNTGYPIIEIFHFATGSTAASCAMASTLIFIAGCATIGLLASSARMLWALARDKAFPFSQHLSRVNKKHQMPTIAILATSAILILLGLVNIGSTTAFNAILSLSVFGLHVSYMLPVLFMVWRRIQAPGTLTYGPWRLGHMGLVTNVISLCYLCFTCVFMLFPPYQPVTAENMNYASLLFGAVIIFSSIYWVWKGRKDYKGPAIDLMEY